MEILTLIVTLILLLVLFFIVVRPTLSGAPYYPINSKNLLKLLKIADITKGDLVADLGSGDGKIVIEIAKRGVQVHGYEINPILVFTSRQRLKLTGLHHKATIISKSYWKADLSKYNVIIVFGITRIMPKLEKKLRRECKKGTKIISHVFKFPNWKYTKKLDYNYLYLVN